MQSLTVFFLGLLCMASSLLTASPVSDERCCPNCDCTAKSHCGCFANERCECYANRCNCGHGEDCKCGDNCKRA